MSLERNKKACKKAGVVPTIGYAANPAWGADEDISPPFFANGEQNEDGISNMCRGLSFVSYDFLPGASAVIAKPGDATRAVFRGNLELCAYRRRFLRYLQDNDHLRTG